MKIDKYGIIMYKNTDNLGDDIQTYAAYSILPKVDYVIDREKLSEFVPDRNEKVKVIMNGWFNHDKVNFLPTPYIYPLPISMHFSKNDLVLDPGHNFLEGYAKERLKKYEPIGCRDLNTAKDLSKLGYKTYFSSCMTTTIDKNKIPDYKEKDYICAVDLPPKMINHLSKITNKKIIETTHWLIFDKDDLSYKEKKKIINEYTKKSFEERKKYVKKHADLSFEKRMRLVEKQLSMYKNASLVITDRIHVALPCLAMNVPVLLIYYDYNGDRVKTFKQFLNNCSEEQFYKMNEKQLLKITNKNDYVFFKNEILLRVNNFIESEVEYSEKDIPAIEDYREMIKVINYNKNLYLEKINSDKEKIKRLEKNNNELKNKIKRIEEENKPEIEEYRKIKNSRTWKVIGKYYRRLLNK